MKYEEYIKQDLYGEAPLKLILYDNIQRQKMEK